MKIIKILFKIFIISVIITAIVTAGIALYMKLYGKSVLQDTLSKLIGSDIKYESLSLNLKEYKVNFKGFTIMCYSKTELNTIKERYYEKGKCSYSH